MSEADQTVFPYLGVDDAPAAMAWYQDVFDAVDEGPTLRGPDGAILHAELRIGASLVFLAEASADPSGGSPKSLGGSPVRMAVTVPDVDRTFARAVAAGAETLIPVADQFYGYRAGRLRDPFGHLWIVSTPTEEVDADEMQRRLDKLMANDQG